MLTGGKKKIDPRTEMTDVVHPIYNNGTQATEPQFSSSKNFYIIQLAEKGEVVEAQYRASNQEKSFLHK